VKPNGTKPKASKGTTAGWEQRRCYMLTGDEAKEENVSPEFQNEVDQYILRGFTHRLVAWGSERFLREYVAFKETIKKDTDAALLHFEKLLLEIQRDLGYSNKKLPRGDLLKVFLYEPGIDVLTAAEGQSDESQKQGGSESA
jgi:hypothetical protein